MSYDADDDDTLCFPASISAVTERAILVFNEDANEEQWVPRSCISGGADFTDKNVDDCFDAFEVTRWKAKELGWEE
jgi:hypothetical protein